MTTRERVAVAAGAAVCVAGLLCAQTEPRVVGYYTMWGKSTLPVSAVQFDKITHINHAFAWPTASGGITSDPIIVDTALIGAAHRAGRKILISLGGASSSTNFSTVVGDTARRHAFVRNLVNYVVNNHYDGADLDWEGPANAADSINDVALMRELREAFDAADSALLLTMAIGSSPYGGRWRDYDSLNTYVDWFNVMTYDMDQGWSGKSGFNAALYYYAGMGDDYSVDQSITYLSGSRRIPPAKLLLGVPFYGKKFNGTSTFNTPFTPPMSWPFFRDIVVLLRSGGWTRYWEQVANVPYLSNVSSFITYDDSLSIALKCQYALSHGLGGVMIWELSQDVVNQSQPLLAVIASQVLTPPTEVEAPSSRPVTEATLYENYPNPFNPTTSISYDIAGARDQGLGVSEVSLVVYDVLGREVAVLVNERKAPGSYEVKFDGSDFASGVYLYRLTAGSHVETRSMVLMR